MDFEHFRKKWSLIEVTLDKLSLTLESKNKTSEDWRQVASVLNDFFDFVESGDWK